MAGKKILIIFYSETGHTRQIADELAAALGATIERIEAADLSPGVWGFARRMWQSVRSLPARIVEPAADPAQFDVVLVGSPVWAGHVASPVRAWLRKFSGKVKAGAPFVSCSKSGAERALSEMDRLLDTRILAHLSVCDEDRVHGRDVGRIQDFAMAVEDAAGLRPVTEVRAGSA